MERPVRKRIFWFSLSTKKEQILLLIQISLLVCIGISSSLWFPVNNFFPRVPVFSFLQPVPNTVIAIFSAFTTLILVASIIFAQKKRLIFSFIPFFILTCLLDQMMWQPWSYYFAFILFTLALFYDNDEKLPIGVIQFLLSCIYIFSGLQKFNAGFALQTYPWLIEPITSYFSDRVTQWANQTFLLAPVIETLAGIGLLFSRTQSFSKWTLIGMHLFILSMLGPLGHSYNMVVWPWNLSFILLLGIVFSRDSGFSIASFLKLEIGSLKYVSIVLFGILPILSFFNLWPMHFSSALYSGNKIKTEVFLPTNLTETFPEYLQVNFSEFENAITLNSWTQAELNVAVVPEKKVHQKIFVELCNSYPEFSQEILMTTYGRPNIFTGERKEHTVFCD